MIFFNNKFKYLKMQWCKEFWPVSLMENCSIGSALQKEFAYKQNCQQKNVLLAPMINWLFLFITGLLWLSVLGKLNKIFGNILIFYSEVFVGVVASISAVMWIIFAASFLFMCFIKK